MSDHGEDAREQLRVQLNELWDAGWACGTQADQYVDFPQREKDVAEAIAALARRSPPPPATMRDAFAEGYDFGQADRRFDVIDVEGAWAKSGSRQASLPLAPPQAQAWQPIETAPKDGTYVLVAEPDSRVPTVANYVKFDPAPPPGYRDGWCYEIGGRYLDRVPTHWMPLRDTPAFEASSLPLAGAQEPTCITCGEPKSAHTKSEADWRTVPGCTGHLLGGSSGSA